MPHLVLNNLGGASENENSLHTISYHRADIAFWGHCTVSPECLYCVSHPGLGQAGNARIHFRLGLVCLYLTWLSNSLAAFCEPAQLFLTWERECKGRGLLLPSPTRAGMVIWRASRHFCIISCHSQQEGCTGALDQELNLVNILFCLAGDPLLSQASSPGSLKGQVKSRTEGNSLDLTLIIHVWYIEGCWVRVCSGGVGRGACPCHLQGREVFPACSPIFWLLLHQYSSRQEIFIHKSC